MKTQVAVSFPLRRHKTQNARNSSTIGITAKHISWLAQKVGKKEKVDTNANLGKSDF